MTASQFKRASRPRPRQRQFQLEDVIERLPRATAIGHGRYATTGEVALRNVQPLFADFDFGGLAICHNGNLTNSYRLRRQLVRRGSIFHSTSDTEVIVHLIATSLKDTVVDRLTDALRQLEGAYSLVALSQEELIGVRDPLGVRPLVLGRLGRAPGSWPRKPARSTSSAPSSCATSSPARSSSSVPTAFAASCRSRRTRSGFCVFEYIYFARPD